MSIRERLSENVLLAAADIGASLRMARIRRNDTIKVWAERLNCSHGTVSAMEAGDVAVAIGYYLAAAEILGKAGEFAAAVSPDNDLVGVQLAFHARRKRARRRSRPDPSTGAEL